MSDDHQITMDSEKLAAGQHFILDIEKLETALHIRPTNRWADLWTANLNRLTWSFNPRMGGVYTQSRVEGPGRDFIYLEPEFSEMESASRQVAVTDKLDRKL